MALQLLRKGLRLRTPPRLAANPARSLYELPPEDPISPLQNIIGSSIIGISFFLPIMWYYWDLKRNGILRARGDE